MAGPEDMTPSMRECLTRIAAAGAPMLYCGQTVFWDEPTKAVLLLALDALSLNVPVIAAIHDTDYFSKLPGASDHGGTYAIVPRNDGTTRELWAAIGEISALFGSETPVEVRALRRCGVPVRRLARRGGEGRAGFVDRSTEAWGWRGMVRQDDDDVVGIDVRVESEVAACIEDMVRWATQTTLDVVADEPTRARAARFAEGALRIVHDALARHDGRSLTHAFSDISRRIHGALLRSVRRRPVIDASSRYLAFNRQTAVLARFTPLDWYLDPKTRDLATRAYDQAVEGSGAYALDQFGAGAIPFDLVVRGRGRGTLRIAGGAVMADLPRGPAVLGPSLLVRSRRDLAALVERRFGPGCMVTGKAAILPCMFLSEVVMVLNEGGSVYIEGPTRKLVAALRDGGLGFRLFPVLRLHYATFDCMGALDARLRLPPHLARAFHCAELRTSEFAHRWRAVVEEQEVILHHIRSHSSPAGMLDHAAEYGDPRWESLRDEYARLREAMRRRADEVRPWREDLRSQSDQYRAAGARALELERGSGAIRRHRLKPAWDALAAAQAAGADAETLSELRAAVARHEQARARTRAELLEARLAMRDAHWAWHDLRDRIVHEDSEGELASLRRRAREIEDEVEMERFAIVRDSLLTQALPKADHRPSAWWFLMLDGGECWFPCAARRAEARFEELAESVLPRCWGLAPGSAAGGAEPASPVGAPGV